MYCTVLTYLTYYLVTFHPPIKQTIKKNLLLSILFSTSSFQLPTPTATRRYAVFSPFPFLRLTVSIKPASKNQAKNQQISAFPYSLGNFSQSSKKPAPANPTSQLIQPNSVQLAIALTKCEQRD